MQITEESPSQNIGQLIRIGVGEHNNCPSQRDRYKDKDCEMFDKAQQSNQRPPTADKQAQCQHDGRIKDYCEVSLRGKKLNDETLNCRPKVPSAMPITPVSSQR